MPKFGVSIYSVCRKFYSKEWTPMQGIRWLAEQGAEAIELVPFGIDFLGEPDMIDKCLAAADDARVKIENFSLNANFLQLTDDEYLAEVARVKQFIDVSGRLGVPIMRVDCAGFRRPIETNTTANFLRELPTIVKTYQELCDYAAQYGITILLENHGFHVNGSERVSAAISAYLGIENGQTTEDGLFTLEHVACLGCCSLAPVIMINGEAYGNLTPDKVVAVLDDIRRKEGVL